MKLWKWNVLHLRRVLLSVMYYGAVFYLQLIRSPTLKTMMNVIGVVILFLMHLNCALMR